MIRWNSVKGAELPSPEEDGLLDEVFLIWNKKYGTRVAFRWREGERVVWLLARGLKTVRPTHWSRANGPEFYPGAKDLVRKIEGSKKVVTRNIPSTPKAREAAAYNKGHTDGLSEAAKYVEDWAKDI